MAVVDPLAPFSPAVRAWFETSFPEATPAQAQGWPAIAGGEHTLILAPTGSGKTLSAFLWGIDTLVNRPPEIFTVSSTTPPAPLLAQRKHTRFPSFFPLRLDGR